MSYDRCFANRWWELMAIIWSESIDGNHYEVRTAGASLRLYRNGVHHSQFNPDRPLSGGIWDLLTVTALYRRPESVQRALILGFGAGAAGRLLMELVQPEQIVGIDLDPIHLSVADSFFECSHGCELLAADAIEWVQATSDQNDQYDWILDDLYGEEDGLPVRCGPKSTDWFRRLASRVKPDGMLVINLVEPGDVRSLPILTDPQLQSQFPYVIQLSMSAYDNRVLALSALPFSKPQFESRLEAFCGTFPRCRGVGSKYRVKRLRGH